ncbi:MAG: restriction endonuclease subunit S [Bacteroidales bacterium]
MKSNYNRIGDYIQLVDERNKGLKVENLLGLSISKQFIPSVANIIGTDMENYKIISKNQFACSLMQVRRDKKMPVALLQDFDKAIISQAYPVFEVKDDKELIPEYLMMWFSRSEFDRETCFHAVGGVRGSLEWEDFIDLKLPIPSIEKQREIVEEYNTIQNRITLNQNLIQKLESTAQAIYKEWFVDFEFPNEEGKPYKTNGGEMVWCEELEKEIPKGWEVMKICSICEITSSKRIFESEYQEKGIPFYRGKEITQKKSGEVISDIIYISKERYNEIVKKYGKPNKGDILMTAVGTLGSTYMVEDENFYFKDGNVIWFKNFKRESSNYFLYDFMQTKQFADLISEITIGSTQSAITIKSFEQQKIVFPNQIILERYINLSIALNKNQDIKKKEQLVLNKLKELLFSKLSTN